MTYLSMEKSKINKIIQEEIQAFFEDFTFNNDQKIFDVNPAMISCAQKGLNAIQSNDLTDGVTKVLVKRKLLL